MSCVTLYIVCCVITPQIAVPSRTDVPEYQKLRSMVHEIVGRINGAFGTLTYVPIHHLDRQLSFHELCALYAITGVGGLGGVCGHWGGGNKVILVKYTVWICSCHSTSCAHYTLSQVCVWEWGDTEEEEDTFRDHITVKSTR